MDKSLSLIMTTLSGIILVFSGILLSNALEKSKEIENKYQYLAQFLLNDYNTYIKSVTPIKNVRIVTNHPRLIQEHDAQYLGLIHRVQIVAPTTSILDSDTQNISFNFECDDKCTFCNKITMIRIWKETPDGVVDFTDTTEVSSSLKIKDNKVEVLLSLHNPMQIIRGIELELETQKKSETPLTK